MVALGGSGNRVNRRRTRRQTLGGRLFGHRRLGHRGGLPSPPRIQPIRQGGVAQRQDRGGQQGGVDRSRTADRQGGYRNAGRHLDDRQQAVHALQRVRLDRHAQYRQRRPCGRHARQMRRSPSTRYDHPQAPVTGGRGIVPQPVRRPVRGDDAALVRHIQRRQHIRRMRQRRPIRLAAHDDANLGHDDIRWGNGHVARPSGDIVGDQAAFQPADLVA